MSIKDTFNAFFKGVNAHSPEILTGAAIVGVGVTIILVAKAAPKVKDIVDEAKENLDDAETPEDVADIREETAKELVKECWPAALSTVITITCIISSNRIAASRQAALASAASMTQASLLEYKRKAREFLGNKKYDDMETEYGKDVVGMQEYRVRTGRGTDLCCESITGIVFYSDIDYILRKWHELDDLMRQGEDVTLNDWLYELGLMRSVIGDELYWRYDLDIGKGTVNILKQSILTDDDEPCFYINYDRYPDLTH